VTLTYGVGHKCHRLDGRMTLLSWATPARDGVLRLVLRIRRSLSGVVQQHIDLGQRKTGDLDVEFKIDDRFSQSVPTRLPAFDFRKPLARYSATRGTLASGLRRLAHTRHP
jgi:hypothetical protein